MHNKGLKRLLSVLLASAMVLSQAPDVYAETISDEAVIYDEGLIEEVSADGSDTEALISEDAGAEEPNDNDTALIEDAVVPETDMLADNEAGTDRVTSDSEEEISSFKGMPEGYELSREQLEDKQLLIEHNSLDIIKGMTEGRDYAARKIVYTANTREDALLIAQAYNSELTYYSDGSLRAVAMLPEGVSVYEAVVTGLGNDTMPPVWPSYITRLEEPAVSEETIEDDDRGFGPDTYTVPQTADYNTWVQGVNGSAPLLSKPDKYLKNPASSEYQWFHEMINTYGAWSSTMGRSSIRVAVIDTGVQADHPDLKNRVTQVKVGSIAAAPASGKTHGTHVAGIIAASAGNDEGGAGVAPGVTIISLNIFGNSDGYEDTDLESAIDLAVSNKADVINMSLGGTGYDPGVQRAINDAYNKGITVIAAMGNDSSNYKCYPAAMDNVIAVTSVNKDGALSQFSTYGPWADIAAPGSNIMSTIPGSKYEVYSGTSMAAPVVSGVAALYMSRFGNPGSKEMEKLLKNNSTKVNSSEAGKGIVNAFNMFKADGTLPVIKVTDSKGTEITDLKTPAPAGSKVTITRNTSGSRDTIVYTTDGSNPSFKDGVLVNGDVYSSAISLDNFASASSVTIKAQVITGAGKIGKVVQLKATAPDTSSAAAVQVKSVKLETGKIVLNYRPGNAGTAKVKVSELIDKSGNKVNLSAYKYEWTSSNPKVVKAEKQTDGSVKVTATGKGSAKVTLNILDGSKKNASFNVNVLRLADSISVTGQTVIEAGKGCSYKANVLPADTNNKKVTWTISGTVPEGVTISNSGKVSVAKTAANGASFTVLATADDGSNAYGTMTVKIKNMVKSVSISAGSDSRTEIDKKGQLKSIRIYTCNLSGKSGNDRITLNVLDDQGIAFPDAIWTSGNSNIAQIMGSSTGSGVVVRGVMQGSTNISVTANDGSGKKASVKVNVIVPASGLTLLPNDEDFNTIIVGKSTKATAVLGSAYGTPTVKNIDWSFKIQGKCTPKTVKEGSYDIVTGFNDSGAKDVTSTLKDAVKISKDGKISINAGKWEKGMLSLGYYDKANKLGPAMKMTVTAKTTDGTGFSASSVFYVNFKPVYFGVVDWRATSTGVELMILSSAYYGPLDLKSSAPNNIGVVYSHCEYEKIEGLDVFYYYINIDRLSEALPGSVSITCKPKDGGFSYKYSERLR